MRDNSNLPQEERPKLLDIDSEIQFCCQKAISCFNACCRQADITLTPYDVIRLKGRLNMSGTEFLQAHTVPFQMDSDGLPGIKMRTDDDGVCLFVTEEGCAVYTDRPSACRNYPLGHIAIKVEDASSEELRYFIVNEPHCKGHFEGTVQSIDQYRENLGITEYEGYNSEWLQIVLKKRSAGPAVGRPSKTSLQLFFMASYDLDRFRRFVLSEAFRNTYVLDESTFRNLENEDLALMQFGVRFMRQVFFGERTVQEQEGAWDKRLEDRKAVWEARRELEIARKP